MIDARSLTRLVAEPPESRLHAILVYPDPVTAELTLTTANAMIEAALAASTAAGFRPMAVVVLDEAGHLKAAQRQDGASMFRIDVATGKAWAAVAMGASSRVLSERAASNPNFFVSLASTAHGQFPPPNRGSAHQGRVWSSHRRRRRVGWYR